MQDIIPRHLKANTWVVMIIFSAVTFAIKRNTDAMIGAWLVVAGMFIADQTTHLSQENHADSALTPVEKVMQYHRWRFVVTGWVLTAIGLAMMLSP